MRDLNNNIAVFTVCNLRYLHLAKTLADSVFQRSKLETHIFIFDKKIKLDLDDSYIKIYWIEELADTEFYKRAFKYNVIELTTAYKPFLAQYLLKTYKKVVFFDPDIFLFGEVGSIIKSLDQNDFLLTPHRISIIEEPKLNIHLQRFGFYNLGFFAANNSSQSIDILKWWWNQCKEHCFDESHYGSFTDQKWIDIAVKFFSKIHILENPSFNVAWWNLKERQISLHNQRLFVNGRHPLIFFHFSSFDEKLLSTKQFDIGDNDWKVLREVINVYNAALIKNQFIKFDNHLYSYDYFENGKYINQIARRAYYTFEKNFQDVNNPFKENKKIDKFFKKNFLYSTKSINYLHVKEKDLGNFKIQYKLLKFILRTTLRIIGPSYFQALLRLFIYLGTSTSNSHIWIKQPDMNKP